MCSGNKPVLKPADERACCNLGRVKTSAVLVFTYLLRTSKQNWKNYKIETKIDKKPSHKI